MAAVCLGLTQGAIAIEARIDGVEGNVADNVRYYLDGLDTALYSRSRVESEVQRRTREALRVHGYYEPRVTLRLAEGDPPEHVELMIEPGPRVRIEVLDIRLDGDAAEDPRFREAVAAFPLAVGDPLVHAPYDRLRSRLANLSLERGYFDWRFVDRRMEVRPHAESARLYLALDSGPRHRFGDVTIEGSHIAEARLRRMLPFSPGDPYLAGELARYNQRLGETGWFGSIAVRPRLGEAASLALPAPRLGFWNELDVADGQLATQAPSAGPRPGEPRLSALALEGVSALQRAERRPEVPIDVSVTPADRHKFEIGLGYATDVGPRTRFAWNQPWINRYGHGLDHGLFLSAPEQRFTGTYTMPLANPLRDSYRFQYGFRHRDNEDTRSLEATLEAARRWEFENRWVQTIYVRTTYEDFTQGGEEAQVVILYPGISWSRTRTRNPTFPSWGDRQSLAFEVSDDIWGSDADFLRMTGETQWIRMFGDDTRFVTRLGLGAIETDDFDKVPPSLRFFAGGDRSVRGYAYESLAPRNEEGRLVGGQQLFTASAELQRRLTGAWWGAAFVDTGDAFAEWGPDALNTGAGLGVRWVSPVGPIRFDVAHPFDDEDDSWRIHFAIGPEF
ncbi:autotransporter assembly complex protein TamA [Halomonas sp. C05BenzN]|uniref:autotransporter assembly complex protein TamA n=1 Tax=Halomonas sp. C05BenzN TaxID=3411041 RepID=UPI003B9592D4